MESGQKFVVRCHKKINGNRLGLGNNIFTPGKFLTNNGVPTRDLNEAHVYQYCSEDNDFDFEDTEWGDGETMRDFFEPVLVRVKVEIDLDNVITPCANKACGNDAVNGMACSAPCGLQISRSS